MQIRELSQTKQALGGDVTLAIVTSVSASTADQLFHTLWRAVYVFERQFSRFLPMSELSAFNRSAGLRIFISPEFKDILTKAYEQSLKTNGLYNPFILPALQRAGYVRSAAPGYEHDPQEDHSHKVVVSVDHLTIGDDWASIPYGTALDMGGCGKGYLADQLGAMLQGHHVVGYWLSLGGDVATMGHDANGDAITLDIQDANNLSGVTSWTIQCPSEHFAIATSGTFRRQTQTSKEKWHHIIDPRTLKPATTDIRLATVCARSALDADVLASCAVILGSKKAPAYLKKHQAQAALLQCTFDDGQKSDKKFGRCIQKSSVAHGSGALQNA